MSEATITIGNYDYEIATDCDRPVDRAATLYLMCKFFPGEFYLSLYGDLYEEDARRLTGMMCEGVPTLRQLEEDDSFIVAFPDKPRQRYLIDDDDRDDEP